MSAGTLTCFWAGRRGSIEGCKRVNISCKGTSAVTRSLSESTLKVPEGAAWRNSPKVIFTAPKAIWESMRGVGMLISDSPTSAWRTRCMRSAGSRAIMHLMGMLKAAGTLAVVVTGGRAAGSAWVLRWPLELGAPPAAAGRVEPGASVTSVARLPKNFFNTLNIGLDVFLTVLSHFSDTAPERENQGPLVRQTTMACAISVILLPKHELL
jgi:hypothetical protein